MSDEFTSFKFGSRQGQAKPRSARSKSADNGAGDVAGQQIFGISQLGSSVNYSGGGV